MNNQPVRSVAVQHATPDYTVSPPPGAQAQPSFEVNLGDMLKGLWRRRWTIITFVFLGVLAGLAAAFAMTPTYTSEAKVMLDNRRNDVLDTDIVSGLTLNDETVETEIEVVASRDIKLRTAKAMNLPALLSERAAQSEQQSWLFQIHGSVADWLARRQNALSAFLPAEIIDTLIQRPERSEPADFNAAVRFLNENMEPRQAGNTSVLVIKSTDQDADLAARIANQTADVYLRRQLEWKARETSGANDYLQARITDLEDELSAKRAQFQQLRNATGEVGETGGTLLAQRRLLSNQRLLDSRNERIKLETKLEEVRSVLNTEEPSAIAIMVDTPLMVQLRSNQSSAQQELAELSNDFGERHPRFIEALSTLDEIAASIQGEAQRHVSALRTELRAAQREEALLRADLSSQNEEDQALDADRNAAEALRSEIAATQSLLDDYLTRFKDADEQRAVLRPDARIISEAVPNEFANFPNRKIVLAGTVAVFGLLGLIMALIRDAADRSLRSISSAERVLKVPVLGLIPILKGRFSRWQPVEYVATHPTTAFSEAMRTIFTALGLRPHQDKGQVLLVTSALPGEGKSSTVGSIAHQVSRAGLNAIVIECDLRRPSLAKSLQGSPSPGIIQLLEGRVDMGQAIQRHTHYGMDFISAGGTSENSLFMFQSNAMRELLDQLSGKYDLIMLDSPPVIALPDAQVLADHAHSILYLCRWGKTPRDTSAAGIRMLVRQGGAPVMAALTHVDMKRYSSYDETYGDPSIERYYAH